MITNFLSCFSQVLFIKQMPAKRGTGGTRGVAVRRSMTRSVTLPNQRTVVETAVESTNKVVASLTQKERLDIARTRAELILRQRKDTEDRRLRLYALSATDHVKDPAMRQAIVDYVMGTGPATAAPVPIPSPVSVDTKRKRSLSEITMAPGRPIAMVAGNGEPPAKRRSDAVDTVNATTPRCRSPSWDTSPGV